MVCHGQPVLVKGVPSHGRRVGLDGLLKVPSNPNSSMISTPRPLTPAQQTSGRGCRQKRCLSIVSDVSLLSEYHHPACQMCDLSSQPTGFD